MAFDAAADLAVVALEVLRDLVGLLLCQQPFFDKILTDPLLQGTLILQQRLNLMWPEMAKFDSFFAEAYGMPTVPQNLRYLCL